MTLKLKYGESLTLAVFSLMHKRKGPRVSDSLKKFLNGDAGHKIIYFTYAQNVMHIYSTTNAETSNM